MLNNLINFFNLLSTKFVKKKADPDDVLILGVPDKRYDGGYKPVMIKVKDFGGGGGPVCDITMEQKSLTLGPAVTVTVDLLTQIPPVDVLIPGQLELTYDFSINFLNVVDNTYPTWNSIYCGFPAGYGDISDYETRPYCPWAIYGASNIETIMYDASTGTYWKFFFTYFAFRSGFSYTRQQIIPPDLCELTFSDGTKFNSAKGLVVGSGVTETVDVDGFVTYTVSSGLNYSNVAFVDPVNGNNSTALINRADKPFTSIYTALNTVSTTATSPTQRGLVYVRRGTYSAGDMGLYWSYVDVYCEPGVVFNGGITWIGAVDTNVYGYAKYLNNAWIRANNPINGTFEIDRAESTGIFMLMDGNCSGKLNFKANSIKSGSVGTSHGISLRGSANYTFDIKEFYEGGNWMFSVRYASGRIVINCPRLIIDDTGTGNNKGLLGFYENYNVNVVVNGNVYSNESLYRGSISGVFSFWAGGDQNVTFNGNVYAGFSIGAFIGWSSPNSQLVINGSISSRTQCVYNATNAQFIQQNGFMHSPSTMTNPMVRLINDARAYFTNVGFKNEASNLNDIVIENAAVGLNMHNCMGQSAGTGEFIFTTVPVNVRIHNVRANKPLNVQVTDLLTPTGFINDPQTIVYTFK